MNAKELIEILLRFDPGSRVVVAGYEAGFNDISEVEEITILPDVHREWYYGAHDKPDADFKRALPGVSEVKAIYLKGKNPETAGLTDGEIRDYRGGPIGD
jgi:hypothetical protein